MIDDQIKILSKSLEVGESSRHDLCPKCAGGSSQERSFIITRTICGLLFLCHRASCGFKGLIRDFRATNTKYEPKLFQPSYADTPLETLPLTIYTTYLEKYGLPLFEWRREGAKYAPSKHALYLPIYNPYKALIGAQLKYLDKPINGPKVLSFKEKDEPFLHFPLNPISIYEELVLVEDYISAFRTSLIMVAVSLNGTSISDQGIRLLKHIGAKRITLMLDGDGAGVAATKKLLNKLNGLFVCRPIYLGTDGTDPKDVPFKTLEEYLLW